MNDETKKAVIELLGSMTGTFLQWFLIGFGIGLSLIITLKIGDIIFT